MAKDFPKTLLGYNPKEVREFIDLIAKSVDDLRKQTERLKTELDLKNQRIIQLEEQTSAIKQTLDIAKEKSELMIKESIKQKEEIIQEAHRSAKHIIDSYQADIGERKHVLLNINYAIDSYINRFNQMIEKTANSINDFNSSQERSRSLMYSSDVEIHEKIDETSFSSSRFKRYRSKE